MRSILLVEDDPVVAGIISEMLTQANYGVDGPYYSLSDSMEALAKRMPAGAVLDIGLTRGDVALLVDDLDLYDIPYLFCSGGFDHPIVTAHPAVPFISQLALGRRLIPTLRRILH